MSADFHITDGKNGCLAGTKRHARCGSFLSSGSPTRCSSTPRFEFCYRFTFVILRYRSILRCHPATYSSGTRILSDMWAAYNDIQNLPQNYGHGAINHRYHFVDPNDATVHTQNIENTWLHFKRMHMKKSMGCKTELFGTYLTNFMWRRRFGHNEHGHNQPNLLIFNLWSQIRNLYP